MNNELETLEKLISFAFVMSENIVGLTKGNYDENQFIKKTYEYLHKYNVDLNSKLELKKSLQRLESIDNSNPSEALKLAELLECDLQATNDLVTRTINGYDYLDILETIKQALLKAQEQEKENKLLKEIIKRY